MYSYSFMRYRFVTCSHVWTIGYNPLRKIRIKLLIFMYVTIICSLCISLLKCFFYVVRVGFGFLSIQRFISQIYVFKNPIKKFYQWRLTFRIKLYSGGIFLICLYWWCVMWGEIICKFYIITTLTNLNTYLHC